MESRERSREERSWAKHRGGRIDDDVRCEPERVLVFGRSRYSAVLEVEGVSKRL